MAAKLKKGDKVVVLSGKDKGKQGEISSVNPSAGKAIIDGVNMAVRHTKQSQSDQGGRIPVAMPIQLSNLALVDSKGKATRVGFRDEEGKKVRYAKSTGETV
ncbi:MAG: 50S ribosomal protein L24 [Planktomarina sp.]|jgi:large subunit ribosomal protein L24|nr:50S ribosomal protein L24 [Planktomarina sp.]MDB4051625.1 50S ribosomal protein L24 [Planktomarina sp.]MDB9923977.1 50S ribosomal protein L24 [Planktomarina sp.]MDS9932587.1 50S ribosomal protein L24 [Planktomarina sp.]|tara:strand:+ start:1032 stop:1337 length:306 start_codon:yes stop_codon:yes gene_type:complete